MSNEAQKLQSARSRSTSSNRRKTRSQSLDRFPEERQTQNTNITVSSQYSGCKRLVVDEISESIFKALDNTFGDKYDSTLNSTFSASQLDDAYEINKTLDDSVTEQKRVAKTEDKHKTKTKKEKQKTHSGQRR